MSRPSSATWQAIQAQENADTCDASFWFIPRSGAHPEVQAKDPRDTEPGPLPASLWPTSIAGHLGALAHNLAPNAPQDSALVALAVPEGRPTAPNKEVLG
ncbi:MAG: hypothetical protein ACK4K3_00005 [Aquabacterium sp.]|jgi:hypothetical protein